MTVKSLEQVIKYLNKQIDTLTKSIDASVNTVYKKLLSVENLFIIL